MNIVLIEDEHITAEDLQEIILSLVPEAQVTKVLHSVKDALSYFRTQPLPDLIFSDIQLGDGLSFEIFRQMNIDCPIIFCTAYDEYALSAFETNGIHYILKPFDETKIAEAIEKFQKLKTSFKAGDSSLNHVLDLLQNRTNDKQKSVLVYYQEKIIPIKLSEVALFYIHNELTFLHTFENKAYYINKSLDEIQQLLNSDFYRANRRFIINRNAVKEAKQMPLRKISVQLNFYFVKEILVSKEKMTDFLNWLQG